jgi:hypothetical protein
VGSFTVFTHVCFLWFFCDRGATLLSPWWQIIGDTALALHALHHLSPPIIHRDIKVGDACAGVRLTSAA